MPHDIPPSWLIEFAGATDVGNHRANNEDAWWAGPLTSAAAEPLHIASDRLRSDAGVWLAVSDGLGGANAGEIASRIALLETQACLAASPRGRPTVRGAWDALQRANGCVLEASRSDVRWLGMGATLSFLWIEAGGAVLGQVGDSRIYRLRRETLAELSVDHSPVGRLRQSGQLTETEARFHPHRHVIDQCLGGGETHIRPDCLEIELRANDVLLLCTDGLVDGVCDAEIARVLTAVARGRLDLARAVEELIVLANALSGRDNVTAVVVRCLPDGG